MVETPVLAMAPMRIVKFPSMIAIGKEYPEHAGHASTSSCDFSVDMLSNLLQSIADHVSKYVLAILGVMESGVDVKVRTTLEQQAERRDILLVLLDTPGGLIEVVQRIAVSLRHHYTTIHFLVLDRAMSAGTVLALSGDAIFMDYCTCLGPIDPQIVRDGRAVSGLSYLRQYERLHQKAKRHELSAAEAILLGKLDLAELDQIKLAEEKSALLADEWLSTYKFRDWNRDGVPVSFDEKKKRAKLIAMILCDCNRWEMHGHGIHKDVLEQDLKCCVPNRIGPDSPIWPDCVPDCVNAIALGSGRRKKRR